MERNTGSNRMLTRESACLDNAPGPSKCVTCVWSQYASMVQYISAQSQNRQLYPSGITLCNPIHPPNLSIQPAYERSVAIKDCLLLPFTLDLYDPPTTYLRLEGDINWELMPGQRALVSSIQLLGFSTGVPATGLTRTATSMPDRTGGTHFGE